MKRDLIGELFVIGMWWRMVYGILRIAFGLAILKFVGSSFVDMLHMLMSHELSQDPHDILITLATQIFTKHSFYITYFLASYFMFWGVIDVTLSYCLLRDRVWAFPISLVLIAFFILYSLVRFTHTHSLILLWLIFVDTVIAWLIYREYKRLTSGTVESELA